MVAAGVGEPYENDDRGVLAPEGGVRWPEVNAPIRFFRGLRTSCGFGGVGAGAGGAW